LREKKAENELCLHKLQTDLDQLQASYDESQTTTEPIKTRFVKLIFEGRIQ